MPLSNLRQQSIATATRTMRLLGGLSASIFAIAIPFLYFGLSVYALRESLTIETTHFAKTIERIVQAQPDMWEFEHIRLLEIVSTPSLSEDLDERTIRTAAGTVVVKTVFSATRPAITVSAAFFDSGIPVGSIEVRHSIRKQLFITALLGMLGSSLGYLLFFIFRTYPIRRLENALADLQRAEEKERRNREEAERLAKEMAIIAEIGQIISSTINIEEVYERFAEEVRKVIPFDRIVINIIDVEKNTVINVYMAGHGVTDRKVGVRYPLEGSGNFEMVRTKSNFLIQTEDFDEYKDRFPMLLSTFQAGFRSIMNVPIFSKGEIKGGLLLRSLRPYAYTEKDVRLAERVGNQIAGAIANAQLFAELKESEGTIKKSEERYRAILENIQEGYYEVDLAGNFTFFNPSMSKILGYTEEEMMGMNYRLYTDKETGKTTFRSFNEIYKTGISSRIDYELKKKDGSKMFAETSVALMRDSFGQPIGFRGVIRDVTKRKQAEEEQRRHRETAERLAAEMAIIAEIARLISSTLDIDKVYERFAAEARKLIPFDRIAINLYDFEENTSRVAYVAGLRIGDREPGSFVALAESVSEELIRTQTSLLFQPASIDEIGEIVARFPSLSSTFQARLLSLMGIPLVYRNEEIGVLHFWSKKLNAYTERDIHLAKRIGAQIAGAIANAQLFTELKKTEEMYRLSFENAMDVIYTIDTDLNIISISPSVERILEYKPQDLIGRPVSDLGDILTPESFEQATADMSLVLKGETIPATIYRFIAKDGTIKFGEVSVSPVMRDGKISGIISVARDITERKEAEQKLRDAHAKMAFLINSISSILITVSEDYRIVSWNTEAEKQFGIQEKEALGKPINALGIQWDLDSIMDGIVRCRKKNNTVGLDNVKFLQRDGKEGILGIGISPSFGEKSFGMVTLIQGANITRRKMMESQLNQAQKLESIGQLAAGIAHEINTPTQYVGDNVRFLQTSFEALKKVLMKYEALTERIRDGNACDDLLDEVEETVQGADVGYLTEEIPRAFQQTLEGVERVSRIVQSMKAFAHPGTAEKVPVDINKAIENTTAVARNEWKYAADLVTDFDPSLPLVSCVLGDINQVILNVLVNAAQAVSEVVNGGSGGKGKISISTRQDDPWVEIRISDTGNGIPVEIQPRIFDPFFTTKEVGKGTGQGLTISHTAIVERHHGSITFDTEIGRGTTFIIRLPIKEPINAGNQET